MCSKVINCGLYTYKLYMYFHAHIHKKHITKIMSKKSNKEQQQKLPKNEQNVC